MKCVKFIVKGKVQGVWYRQSTKEKASELGLRGWVSNRDDGTVELLACGDSQQLEALNNWLWEGPPLANVSEVQQSPTDEICSSKFDVRY